MKPTHLTPIKKGLTLLLSGLLTAATASAATFTHDAVNDAAGEFTSFNSNVGDHWGGGHTPTAGNDYVSGHLVRTTNLTATAQTFAGNSLTLNGVAGVGGSLAFNTSGVQTVADLRMNGGNIQHAGLDVPAQDGTATLNGGITLQGSSNSLIRTNGNAFLISDRKFVINSTIGGTGALTLENSSSGQSITLNGANTYSGGTTLQGATNQLILGSSTALGAASGSLNLSIAAAVLNLNGFNQTVGALTGVSGSVITTGGGIGTNTLTVGSGKLIGDSSTFAGILQDEVGIGAQSALTKTGAGTQILSGANTYTGVTSVNQGTLSVGTIGNGGVAGNLGAASNDASSLVFGGGTLRYTGATASSDRAFTISNGVTATIDVTTNNLSIAGATSTATTGALTKIGNGTLTLTGANTYTGLTTVSAGTLAYGVSNALSSGAVTVNGGTLALGTHSDTVGAVTLTSGSITSSTGVLTGTSYAVESGSVSAILAGAVNLTKTTGGTVTLTGANTYSGTTTLTDGVLQAGNNAAFGTSALALNGGTLSSDSGTARAFSNAVTFGGNVTLGNGTQNGVLTFNGAGTLTGNRTITTESNVTYAGVIGGGTNGLTKAGASTLTLTAANTYTGGTTVSSGTLALSGAGRLADTGAVTVNNGGTFDLGGVSDSVGAVALSGGTISNGTLTGTSYAVQSGSVSAVLAGSGAVTKSTGDSVTFSAVNTYTGNTIVSGGTLILSGSGSIANSAVVDVQAGAILSTSGVTFGTGQTVKGNGTIIGDTVLQGTLAAGNSPGILTFNDDLTLTSSANSVFEIQNTGMVRGTDYDGVNVVSSVLTYDGTLTLSLTALVGDGTYNLFDFGSIAGNFDTVAFSGGIYTGTFSHSGGFWTATDMGGSGQTFSFELASGNLTVIPEPSTTLLLAGALTALVIFRRRRG